MSTSNKGHRVEDVGKVIRDSVISGKFMPFLGAGSSGLRSSDPKLYPWDQVSDRMSLLMAHLEQEEDRQYLRSQADAHGIVLNGGDDCLPSKPDEDDHLFSLQKGLVRLGSDLIYLFGQEMSRARRCVAELVDYQVEVSGPRRDRLLELLLDTTEAARNLAESREAERVRGSGDEPEYPNLEARAIYEKLLLFTCRILGQLDKVCHEIRERVKVHGVMLKEQDLLSNVEGEPCLRLDELAWLEDLLWHTLRYNVPSYPTAADLTFQFSLTASFQVVRRGSLPQVAELHGDERALVERVRDWFRFCEDEIRRKPPRRFHLSVAAVLHYEFQKYQQAKGEMMNESCLPIVFTTNYDRTIENALACLNIARREYHVAFPVLVYNRESSVPSTEWFFTTYRVTRTQDPPERSGLYRCMDLKFAELEDYIRGPIVVKLHGSPLEELGDYKVHKVYDMKDEKGQNYDKVEHSLVLSESSYMEAIVGRIARPLPTWIEDALKGTGRDLWFLGYSVSDWNVRLRLYDHLHYSAESSRLRTSDSTTLQLSRLMFDRRYDRLRSAILSTLQVQQYEGELHTFGAYLRRIEEIRRMVESTLELRRNQP